eukprot:scaffold2134_cov93-Cylindrotheca_fusiformis.AAC.3
MSLQLFIQLYDNNRKQARGLVVEVGTVNACCRVPVDESEGKRPDIMKLPLYSYNCRHMEGFTCKKKCFTTKKI